jgi:hypothetical protein
MNRALDITVQRKSPRRKLRRKHFLIPTHGSLPAAVARANNLKDAAVIGEPADCSRMPSVRFVPLASG